MIGYIYFINLVNYSLYFSINYTIGLFAFLKNTIYVFSLYLLSYN